MKIRVDRQRDLLADDQPCGGEELSLSYLPTCKRCLLKSEMGYRSAIDLTRIHQNKSDHCINGSLTSKSDDDGGGLRYSTHTGKTKQKKKKRESTTSSGMQVTV